MRLCVRLETLHHNRETRLDQECWNFPSVCFKVRCDLKTVLSCEVAPNVARGTNELKLFGTILALSLSNVRTCGNNIIPLTFLECLTNIYDCLINLKS